MIPQPRFTAGQQVTVRFKGLIFKGKTYQGRVNEVLGYWPDPRVGAPDDLMAWAYEVRMQLAQVTEDVLAYEYELEDRPC